MWVTPVIFTPASHADKPSLMQYSAANVTTTGNVCFPFCLSVKRTKSSVLSACHQISKCPILCRKGLWGSKFQPSPNDKAHPSPLRCTDNRYLKASSHILFFLVQALNFPGRFTHINCQIFHLTVCRDKTRFYVCQKSNFWGFDILYCDAPDFIYSY